MPEPMGIMIIVIKAVNLTWKKKLNEMKKLIKLLIFLFESAKVEMILSCSCHWGFMESRYKLIIVIPSLSYHIMSIKIMASFFFLKLRLSSYIYSTNLNYQIIYIHIDNEYKKKMTRCRGF